MSSIFRLVQTLGFVGTTAQAYLRVPIGIALGVAFLGERLTPTVWIGLGCVVIGGAQRLFLTAVGAARNPVPASRDRRCPLPA